METSNPKARPQYLYGEEWKQTDSGSHGVEQLIGQTTVFPKLDTLSGPLASGKNEKITVHSTVCEPQQWISGERPEGAGV